jgi:hypothetical protein
VCRARQDLIIKNVCFNGRVVGPARMAATPPQAPACRTALAAEIDGSSRRHWKGTGVIGGCSLLTYHRPRRGGTSHVAETTPKPPVTGFIQTTARATIALTR